MAAATTGTHSVGQGTVVCFILPLGSSPLRAVQGGSNVTGPSNVTVLGTGGKRHLHKTTELALTWEEN